MQHKIVLALFVCRDRKVRMFMKISKLLFDEEPLVISRSLSRILGANKAIALQQIHYWCEKSKNFVNPLEHFIDGKWWVYNTYEEWTKQFAFGSERTVRRTLKELESKGLLLVANHHKDKHNRTNWYAINHEKLDELYEQHNGTVPSGQNDQMGGQVVKTIDNMSTCTSGQSVKENDKMARCIVNTENTQSLSELTNSIELFNAYTQNPKLLIALERFYEMRIELGKQLTLAATKILLDDLDSYADTDEDKILILKKSILNNWKEIFALPKPKKNKDDTASRIETEMKRRGEYVSESAANSNGYYDWIQEIKNEN